MSLNADQEAAVKVMHGFLSSTTENFMCIEGAGGTGKTYLVKHFVKTLETYYKARALLNLKGKTPLRIAYTATTNKACEAFQEALQEASVGPSVTTIHSFLRLTMTEDPKNPSKDILVERDPDFKIGAYLVFIDEASYIDEELWEYLKKKVSPDSKVIFMGDPAQLKVANSTSMPAFDVPRKAVLTKVERFDESSPIQALALELRKRILAKDWRIPQCPIDGNHIIWLDRPKFDRLMLVDMSSPDWTYSTSKFLAFRNKRVQVYNKGLNEHIAGTREFKAGDYAVNNHHVAGTKASGGIGTDRMVYIDEIIPHTDLGVKGNLVRINNKQSALFFLPHDHTVISRTQNKLVKKANALADAGDEEATSLALSDLRRVKNTWVDLRPVYAQTVYKAQGSTFRRVYIDLVDIGACGSQELIMRMLYVACTRARKQLFLTGDLY